MEILKTPNTYYRKIIDLILHLHKEDLNKATAGHCMKITGLGLNELDFLWNVIHVQYPSIDTFIVSEGRNVDKKFISATKLIELRNKQDAPLLVLIPSNSRTAAEDSYGNATFKEISLEGIETNLKNDLIDKIPDKYSHIIKNEVLSYVKTYDASIVNIIKYLLALEEDDYSNKAIGDNLYLLNLIPDSNLIQETDKVRSRLNFNILSTTLLSSFGKPLYERISELPLEPNTLQKEVVNFIKAENEARNAEEICRLIFEKYQQLNFSNWEIPDLDFTHIKLFTEETKSNDFKIEEGKKVLHVEENKISKVRIRFRTNPNPKDISDLKYFKVLLMAVDGGSGQEISVLRQLKNTASNRPFREATVELNANIIEEGSYFFKVLAEDDHGNVLNGDDEFKEIKIQKAWEEAKAKDENSAKSNFPYKLTCDSEDFDYVVDETVERDNDHRKDKLNNVLQAYFKYRIEKLKSGEEPNEPIPTENSNIWLNDLKKHTSTFHINYSDKHNYQISLSSKLREIEIAFLEHSNSFGYVKGVLKSNSPPLAMKAYNFVESELTSIIPVAVLKLREQIFSSIQTSNDAGDGVFETADIFKYRENIKEYIRQLTDWTNSLNAQVSNDNLSSEEKSKIQHFLTELQILDIARIKTKLPDGQRTEALLLSPLHPLRLAWSLQLMEVFNEWEQKTENYPSYRDTWFKNLDYLFEGQLSPENNPLVFS